MLVPAALGHPLIFSDNLNQNVPLHYLAAKIELSGRLPVWNTFSWSGTPLLAGFNVQTFFPLSWLFLILSPTWAFSVMLVAEYSLAAGGIILITRQLGGSATASAIAASSFTLSGVFVSQTVHLDMISGITAIIWSVFCILKMSEQPDLRRGFMWSAALALSFALCVTAGAPEAMLDGVLMIAVFSLALVGKTRMPIPRFVLLLAIAGVLALGLSAIQWIPGLDFQQISNRSAGGYTFYISGPFQPQSLILLLFPFLEGGSGIFNQPAYFGPYNLGEIGSYVSILVVSLGLVGLFTRSSSLSMDRRLNALKAAGIASLLLSLGAYTPLALLMFHVPLYGHQRLPSRNFFGFEIMLCVIAGLTWDSFRLRRKRISITGRLVLLVLAGVTIATEFMYFFNTRELYQILDVIPSNGHRSHPLTIYVIVAGVEILLTVGLLLYDGVKEKSTDWITWILLPIFVAEVGLFGLSTLISQIPGGNQYFANSPSVRSQIALLPQGGRFGSYNPQLFGFPNLPNVLSTDSNVYVGVPSVQGYSSLSLGNYNTLTDSHYLDQLGLPAVNSILHNVYNLDLFNTSPLYFYQATGVQLGQAAPQPPQAELTPLQNGLPTYSGGYFGKPFEVDSVILAPPTGTTTSCLSGFHLLGVSGELTAPSSVALGATPNGDPVYTLNFSVPTSAVGYTLPRCLIDSAGGHPILGIRITTPAGAYEINGVEAPFITPQLWRFVSNSGGISTFVSTNPKTKFFTATQNTTITASSTDVSGRSVVAATSVGIGSIVWNQNYAPGWYALVEHNGVTKREFPTQELPWTTMRFQVPNGSSTVRIYYKAPGLRTGMLVTAASALVMLAAGYGLFRRRKGTASKNWVPKHVSLDTSDLRRP